jgi:tetratricopeptide (TPR) repeat protein
VPPLEPEAEPDRPAATTLPYPLLAAIPEDDPYQCAFCGRLTEPDATRCPHCRRSLLAAGPWHGGGHLYLLLILAGLQTQSAVVQAAGVYGYENFPSFARLLPGEQIWAANLVGPAILRAVLWAVIVVVLISANRNSFRTALAVSAADLAWTTIGYVRQDVGQVLAAANALFSGFIFLICLAAVLGELQARVRLRVVLDKNLQGAELYHRHAAVYAHQGKWALAALHWRRAIALNPHDPAYYKALGHANARLDRAAAAHRAWTSGAELDPADPDYPRLLAHLKP